MDKAVQLLVVEAFAGTYPVARVLQHVNSSVHNALGARLQAYVGIEIQEKLAKKAPTPSELGIAEQHYLNFTGQNGPGDITAPSVQQTVLEFVRRKLQDKQLGIDAALVFGGPTCTVYSNLTRENTRFPHRYNAFAAEAEHTELIRQLAVARRSLHEIKSSKKLYTYGDAPVACSSPAAVHQHAVVAAAAVAKRTRKSSNSVFQETAALNGSRMAQWKQQQQRYLLPPAAAALLAASQAEEQLAAQEAALAEQRRQLAEKAREEAMQDTSALMASDALVSSFISLYRGVQAECMAYGDIPSYIIMENPYSTTARALWNRPFMKAQHLLNLPPAAAAERVKQQTHFAPSSTAWLNCTWQNWCCYSAQHPQKHTVVFTDLPKGALQDRRCSEHCLVQNADSAAAAAAATADGKRSKKASRRVHPVAVRSNPGGSTANAAWPLQFVESVVCTCVSAVRQRGGSPAAAA